MIPLPWRLLGGLVITLALFAGGYGLGAKHAKTECVADQVEAQRAAVSAATKEDVRREAIGTTRETSREQIRIVYKTIKEQAHDYVKNNPHPNPLPLAGEGTNDKSGIFTLDCGLDADGLRLWNAANAGEAAPVSGEPYLSMRRAATRQIGEPDGSADQSYRGDGAVQPVPGSTDETGGVYQPTPTLTLPLQGEGTNVKGL